MIQEIYYNDFNTLSIFLLNNKQTSLREQPTSLRKRREDERKKRENRQTKHNTPNETVNSLNSRLRFSVRIYESSKSTSGQKVANEIYLQPVKNHVARFKNLYPANFKRLYPDQLNHILNPKPKHV